MEMMPMKDLTTNYVMTHMMHKMSKSKKNKPQDEDATMMSRQNKGGNSFSHNGAKSCFHCGKPDLIPHFCYEAKNNEREQSKNAKEDEDYAFVMQNGANSKSVYKSIMYSKASKHMTLYRTAFHTYEVSLRAMYIWLIIMLFNLSK